jgi:two-component system sensor histidine kinase FlrB
MSATLPIPRSPALEPDHPLARAFASFTEAAGSLERTYGQLQEQVVQLRHELEVTNRDLEHEREQVRKQQALVEVSALLAHEIRNPLGSLELFAGLLAESNLTGESQRWIEHVQAGLRTLSATVNNVLHLHNTPQPESAELDAGELVDWAHDFLFPLARQARVELQVVNNLRGVLLPADRHRLEQVLLNLALNAFRFMPGGGWLSICGRMTHDGKVEITVRDTGPGIAAIDLPRIFDAGFSTRPGCCGLGLAVCRKILEQHGGTIAAESRPGHGATFRLTLPRCGEAQ